MASGEEAKSEGSGQEDGTSFLPAPPRSDTMEWVAQALPRIIRHLMDHEDINAPLLQLPIAQLRLAQALYGDRNNSEILDNGETMGHLSEQLHVRHSALTQVADRLIGHGLAERLSDPADRRIVRLRLTGKGQEMIGKRRAERVERLGLLWNALEPPEREEFLRAVHVLDQAGSRLG